VLSGRAERRIRVLLTNFAHWGAFLMSLPFRRATIGLGLVAAIFSSSAGRAAAQTFTWSNAAGGNWSIDGNWQGGTAPTTGSGATKLIFGAPGTIAASYTATNNVGSVPFDLNALTFNGNTGTLVTINGLDNTANALNFTGTNPSITIGAGNATINPLTTLAATTTIGGGGGGLTFNNAVNAPGAGSGGPTFVNVVKTSSGSLVFANGGSIDTLSIQNGSVSLTGGTLNLLAPTGASNVTSGIQLGTATGQNVAFTATGVNAAVNVTENTYVGDAAGSTATFTVSNGATYTRTGSDPALGRFAVGNSGTGTLNVLSGGIVSVNQLFVARLAGGNGTVLVDGTNSLLHAVTQLSFGTAGLGQMTVQNGGSATSDGSINIGRGIGAGINGIVTVTGTGSSISAPNINVAVGGPGTLSVQNSATATVATQLTVANSGGNGILNIQSGGVMNTPTTFTAPVANIVGTINVTGTGSLLNNTGQFSLSGGGGATVAAGTGNLNVTAGGAVTVGGISLLGQTGGGTTNVIVDAGTYTATGQTQLNAGVVSVTVQNSGLFTANSLVFVGTNPANFAGSTFPAASATITVTGAGSNFTTAETAIIVGGQGATPGGTGILNANNGGTISAGGGLILFAGATANVNGGTLAVAAIADGVAGTSVGSMTAASGSVITITGALSGTFTGIISGAGGILKNGGGTQTLGGVNTYTGPTTVAGGTLTISSTGSIAGSTAITVGTAPSSTAILDVSALTGGLQIASGKTLGGHGTIVGAVTVGGTLSPGTSVGTLTINNGPMGWTPGGTYRFEHDASATGTPTPGGLTDLVAGTGTATLDLSALTAALKFNIVLVATDLPASLPSSAVTYTLADFSASSTVPAIIAPAGIVANDLTPFFNVTGDFRGTAPTLSLVNGNVVQITFTPVPEAGSVVLACSAVSGVIGLVRRRRQRQLA
jgi:fibronectin-binding autotransporter adhesin